MYYKEKVIVDTRKFNIAELYERYKRGMIIFPEMRNVLSKRRNQMIREMLEALLKGIPFPVIYASEQQMGELLIFDKSNRLRYLLEYLDNNYRMTGGEALSYLGESVYFDDIKQENPKEARDILYSEIVFYIIDYMNPKYMHMQIGSFLEEWTISQEQSIRKILYRDDEWKILDILLSMSSSGKRPSLATRYEFENFIMFHMVASKYLEGYKENLQTADRFQLYEIVIEELKFVNHTFLQNLCRLFDEVYELVEYELRYGVGLFQRNQVLKSKYMCFTGYLIAVDIKIPWKILVRDRNLRKIIEDCDMSYISICQSIDILRRELL